MSEALLELGAARFTRVSAASRRFFERHAEALALAACQMAQRFQSGGRLFVYGSGPAASDAHHVSVEFLHPVTVGQRALPAMALDTEPARRLRSMRGPKDMAIVIASNAGDDDFRGVLREAHEAGLLSIAMSGAREAPVADHAFVVADEDPTIVQEVQETACHALHELVHLFLQHADSA